MTAGGATVGSGTFGAGTDGAGTGGNEFAGSGAAGKAGKETVGGAGSPAPPGGNRVGATSGFARGATILEASNLGGSETPATGLWPDANAISDAISAEDS